MKNAVLFTLLLTSCGVLETAKQAVSVPYEVGKYHGRQEVLDELAKNKKAINMIKKNLGHQLVEVTLDDEAEVEIQALLPPLLGLVQLLNQRQNLKKHLKNVLSTSSESNNVKEE